MKHDNEHKEKKFEDILPEQETKLGTIQNKKQGTIEESQRLRKRQVSSQELDYCLKEVHEEARE
jgi:hypothetical protein